MNKEFEEYKTKVMTELKCIGANEDEIALATVEVIQTGMNNNRKPEDLAWALIQ